MFESSTLKRSGFFELFGRQVKSLEREKNMEPQGENPGMMLEASINTTSGFSSGNTMVWRLDLASVPELSGSNWSLWKTRMEAALELAGLLDALTNGAHDDASRSRSRAARGAIFQKLGSDDLSLVKHLQDGKSVWDRLLRAYADKTEANAIAVHSRYRALRMATGESVKAYISRAVSLSSELRELNREVTEEDLAITILNGLTSEYRQVLLALQTSNLPLTVDRVRSTLLCFVQHREQEPKALKVNSTGEKKKSSKKKFDKSKARCWVCNEVGHVKANCPKRGRGNSHERAESGHQNAPTAFMASKGKVQSACGDWIVDSGATDHLTGDLSWFDDELEWQETGRVHTASGSLPIKGRGHVYVLKGGLRMVLMDVLYVPGLEYNLFSVPRAMTAGARVTFEDNYCLIEKGNVKMRATPQDDGTLALLTSAEKWHARLGHTSVYVLKEMGLPWKMTKECEVCPKAKLNRASHKPDLRQWQPLDRLSMDLIGPIQPETLGGQRYALSVIDACTKACKVYLLPSKDATSGYAKEAISWFEQRAGGKVKAIRTDNGSEFVEREFCTWLRERGVVHELSAPYEPQQNGMVERLNKTLMEGTRALLIGSELPNTLWGEAMRTVAFVRNLRPAKGTNGKSPAELLTGKVFDLNFLKMWGCKALVHVPEDKRTGKLAPRAIEGIFIGYENSATYRFLVNGKLVLSSTAQFFEEEKGKMPTESQIDLVIPDLLVEPGVKGNLSGQTDPIADIEPTSPSIDGGTTYAQTTDMVNHDTEEDAPLNEVDQVGGNVDREQMTDICEGESQAMESQLGDNQKNQMVELDSTHVVESAGVEMNQTYNLRERETIDYKRMAMGLKVGIAIEDLPDEFSGYTEAMERPDAKLWKLAIEEELRSLCENETWALSSLPNGRKALQSKWVFKVKRDGNGNVDRYKARLVIKGFQQRKGVDYSEVFSPVVSKSAMRVILTVAAVQDLEIEQLDVKTAFLNASIEEEMYMAVPEGVVETPGKVLRLKKSLYGLKQAPRMWNKLLTGVLTEDIGCECISVDESVLTCKRNNSVCYICVYVDDIILATSDQQLLKELIKELSGKFNARHLGPASLFCGMVITRRREKRVLYLSESQKIEQLLHTYGMEQAKEARVPLGVPLSEMKCKDDEIVVTQYQQLVGQLLYISTTVRPDIAHAAATLSRYMSKPGETHWNAAKAVLRYLKKTRDYGLCLGQLNEESDEEFELIGFCDSDYATDKDTRRSRTGYLFLLNGSLITWYSKLQKTVACSTAEAEYMAVSACVKEALWLRNFMGSLLHKKWNGIQIFNDNQACLRMLQDLNSVTRTKHIDVHHHFARERWMRGEVKFAYCRSEDMLADYLTKVLAPGRFEKLISALHVQKIEI